MTKEQLIEDYKVMAKANMEHLMDALSKGHRTLAHQHVDGVIDNVRRLQDLGYSVTTELDV